MCPIRAKKRFGQNFLDDSSIAERIVDAIEPSPGDSVVEIGPGTGVLTKILLERGCRIDAFEADRELVDYLRHEIGESDSVNLHLSDFVRVDNKLLPDQFKLIGNIPYNITTVIFENLYNYYDRIISVVFTIQTEVARRIVSDPGTSSAGSFTIIMAAGFDSEILFDIPRDKFKPAPRVDSTVIKLIPNDRRPDDFAVFKDFVRSCFSHKRKTLLNSMQRGLKLPKDITSKLIESARLNPDSRPEQIRLDDYINLFYLWRKQIKK